MNSIYYFAAWADSGFLLGCDHQHQTVIEAVDCKASVRHAGSYVVAVENGVERALTIDEEAEFQRAPRKQPTPVVLEYEASGYAVMTRLRFVDGWGWDTWMRWDTYEQALAHARPHNKIVPFGSAEWHALRKNPEPALPASTIAPQESQPSRYRGETLVQFVFRLVPSPLDHLDLTDREVEFSVGSEPLRPTLVELVSEWINNWEMKLLERIFNLPVPVRIDALRKRLRKLVNTSHARSKRYMRILMDWPNDHAESHSHGHHKVGSRCDC
jgi:hypothetical protein